MSVRTAPDHELEGYPPGIPYVVGNEIGERFSFYGMRALLFVYLVGLLRARGLSPEGAEREAEATFHVFVAGAYALPMVGALIADRLLGKYRTILFLSLVYCAGHACLALFEGDYRGTIAGLVLIAIGAGGIKPCVSAHVGDQFGRRNFHRVERVYQLFYFAINLGGVLSTLTIPRVKESWGFGVAFAIPGILMGVATFVFWAGRSRFVHVPPSPGGRLGAWDVLVGALLFCAGGAPLFASTFSPTYAALSWWAKLGLSLAFLAAGLAVFLRRQAHARDDGFLAVIVHALGVRLGLAEDVGDAAEPSASVGPFFAPALRRYGPEATEAAIAVLRVLSVFLLVSVFWSLYDQHASSWVAQAQQMDRRFVLFGWRFELLPEEILATNPALVLLLVPTTAYLLYPAIESGLGVRMTPLRKMSVGMFVAAFSFVLVALAQHRLDAGERVHVIWQLVAYLVLTTAEVMISITGLEFAYTQAPPRTKSIALGFWMLTVALGNVLVSSLVRFSSLPRAQFFWLFAGLMALAALLFSLRAARYEYRTYVQ